MVLGGLQRLTLIDYPGKIAATVFTVGCNFRCPFCHNPELVLQSWSSERGSISEEAFFQFLEQRRGKIDGICITGGEPTLQPDILDFMKKIKALGFLIKLDSNGTRPDVLKKVYAQRLADFVAMDIKNCLERYEAACISDVFGDTITVDKERIALSVDLIMHSGVPYEFRTTAVPGIHQESDFECIGRWIKGASHYAIQPFRDGKIIDMRLRARIKQHQIDTDRIASIMRQYVQQVEIRG